MGKAGKERKRRRLERLNGIRPQSNGVSPKLVLPPTDTAPISFVQIPSDGIDSSSSTNLNEVSKHAAASDFSTISAQDLGITIQTLTRIAERPGMIRSKAFKLLRAPLHDLSQQLLIVPNSNGSTTHDESAGLRNLTARISDALSDGRWDDAFSFLSRMRNAKRMPKLGALQRWVRDCDAANVGKGMEDKSVVLKVLDCILRTVDPEFINDPEGLTPIRVDGPVRYFHPWKACEDLDQKELLAEAKMDKCIKSDAQYQSFFQLVQHEKGCNRKPPNKYDVKVYLSQPNTVTFDIHQSSNIKRHEVPHVPGAFMMSNVFTRSECRQIVAAAEAMEFMPDEPLTGSQSVLAHAFVWLADEAMSDILYERVRPFLPSSMGKVGDKGALLCGINRRWRVYRYIPGAVYRPHIDGAWPGSGVQDGQYVYDNFAGTRRSRLTFLVYLNEGFEGGCTTYFTPSKSEGVLNAYAVTPRMGSVVCFPHGDTQGSLLHEGSAVLQGAKYVIRTDVLYESTPIPN